MGGAAGHLQHLYENRDLTFAEIKEILSLASAGKLEQVTEKFDGLNLVLSWDVTTDALRIARRSSDISSGGMDEISLKERFKGRGNLTKAFTSAFKVLNGAIGSLPQKTKQQIFGPQANRWFSVEVIYTENPNVIHYDSNSLVFHGFPVFQTKNGKVSTVELPQTYVKILTQNIQKLQKAIEKSDWRLSGPAIVTMKKLSDGNILASVIDDLSKAMSRAGVSDGNTIGDYLRTLLKEDVLDLQLGRKAADAVVSRCMQDVYAPSLNDIKKIVEKDKYELIKEFVNNSPSLMKSYIEPVEKAISKFAAEILKGLKSTLIKDSSAEVKRIQSEIQRTIDVIEASKNEASMRFLSDQMSKLKSIENITTPMEGVVFTWGGNSYKFTGSFSAVNQILGIFRYGR